MQSRAGVAALAVALTVVLSARAEITEGVMYVRGCEMS